MTKRQVIFLMSAIVYAGAYSGDSFLSVQESVDHAISLYEEAVEQMAEAGIE
jgi:hypothetical protein